MKRWGLIVIIFMAVICFVSTLSYADIPRVINYQGRFTDKDDNPLSGNYLVTFRFYEAGTGGTPLWEEGHILTIDRGIFNVLLGSIKPIDVDFNKDLWLGVEVASDGEMNPRIKLASSAYAFNAQSIDMVRADQLLRNDVDSVMSGNLTVKKNLVLKGDATGPSRIVLSDSQGREYFLWIDNDGGLRLKEGEPDSETDGFSISGGRPSSLSQILQLATPILLIMTIVLLGVVLHATKKK